MESNLIIGQLLKIQTDIDAVIKKNKNQMQGYAYRSVDQVMNELHGLLVKHSVLITQNLESRDDETFETVKRDRDGEKTTRNFRVKLKIRFSFIAADGSKLDSIISTEALDTSDKATNKAMSYAYKYLCFQTFSIPTEEIIDGDRETIQIENNSKPAAKAPNSLTAKLENSAENIPITEAQSSLLMELATKNELDAKGLATLIKTKFSFAKGQKLNQKQYEEIKTYLEALTKPEFKEEIK